MPKAKRRRGGASVDLEERLNEGEVVSTRPGASSERLAALGQPGPLQEDFYEMILVFGRMFGLSM